MTASSSSSASRRAWCDSIFGRFVEARRWFERAREVAVDIGSGWLRGDADVGRSIAELAVGELDLAEETARGVLRSEAALALPALQAVATEALGCRAFLTCRFREAVGYLGEAQRMYRSHHLDRGWGFLVHSEHTEALLCLIEVEGPNAVPDLLPQLRRNRRRAARRMGRIPMYAGCLLVHSAIIASRSGRPEKALRLLDRALAVRPSPRSSYIDIWIVFRVAAERLRLGVAVSEVRPLFDDVERICDLCDARGWFPFIEHMRERFGVRRSLSRD